jgi:arginyl-tRNA synthetase
LDAIRSASDLGDIAGVSEESISIEQPREKVLGELATNAAMVFAERLRMTPRALAENICEALNKHLDVRQSEVAGPGFVNFSLNASAWQRVVAAVIETGDNYGKTNIGNNTSVNVEFVSANPTGPLHTGHARNAVFGSVVASLMEKIGYKVTREFYINDRGNQITLLAQSVLLRYKELLGESLQASEFTEDMYSGEYVKEIARELLQNHGGGLLSTPNEELLELARKFSVAKMLKKIKEDLRSLGVVMDKYTSETEVCDRDMVEEAVKILAKRGDVYEGVLPKPKGKVSTEDDWEERPQTLFRSTKYGDDVDRTIKKSDGSWTYFAGDLAYHLDKIKRGYKAMIAVLGADHNGYVKRLKAAVSALSESEAAIDIRLYQLVNFLEDGKPIRMSKRSGNFITLREVVDKVGKDVTRFMMISRHHDVMIDFDFAKVVECSMKNPLFYIQYAYARICSVFRHSETIFGPIDREELASCDKSVITDEAEISLIEALAFWPDAVGAAAVAIEPHRLAKSMREIASCFHFLWNRGKTNTELRFIDKDSRANTVARLSLLEATRCILEDGLNIMGITPLTEMT